MGEREAYTGATQRLYLDPVEPPAAYAAAPIAARRIDPGWAVFALLVVVLLLTLARLPQQPAPMPYTMPAADNHYEIFSRNCVGYCP